MLEGWLDRRAGAHCKGRDASRALCFCYASCDEREESRFCLRCSVILSFESRFRNREIFSVTQCCCVISSLVFFEQEIPPGSRSGRLKFQGGQVIYVLEGRGHTLIDGVKHSWEGGDLLNLPLRKDGIIVQHVNDDPDKPARFVAVEPNLWQCTGVDRGCGFEVLSRSPDYER